MFHEEPMKESSNIFPGVFKTSLCGRLTRNIPAKLFEPEPADAKQKKCASFCRCASLKF